MQIINWLKKYVKDKKEHRAFVRGCKETQKQLKRQFEALSDEQKTEFYFSFYH